MAPSTRELVIVDDAEVLAREAAKRVIDCISQSARRAVCLTGGSSPRRLYELLGSEPLSRSKSHGIRRTGSSVTSGSFQTTIP